MGFIKEISLSNRDDYRGDHDMLTMNDENGCTLGRARAWESVDEKMCSTLKMF